MMEPKQIAPKARLQFYGAEARRLILKGVDAVANPVKATMGAKGRNVVTSYGHTTKDGVTVARDIELFDAPEAHGANLVKAASIKTCDVAGDGTTVTCVLSQALIHEGMAMIERGKDAQDLKRELEAVKEPVLAALKAQSQPVTDIRAIANISANDEVVGGLVAEAVMAVGVDGLVTIENTYDETRVEVVEGMQIDRGMITPTFITEGERRRAEYGSTKVLIYSGKMHDALGLARVMDEVNKMGNPFLIIADDYDLTVLRLLELNKMRGVKILAIKAPMVMHDDTLADIAAYTGATIITEAEGFKNCPMSRLGHVKSVVSTPERTILRAEESRSEAIKERVAMIYESAKDFRDTEKRNVEKRASRMNGRMAIIKLAATTDKEAQEVRDRIEDAIYASQAALETGIVAGGGYALSSVTPKLIEGELTDGTLVVALALDAPMRQIVKNAGKNEGDIIRQSKAKQQGYNVVTEQFESLLETGVVDPLKVVTTAFENALSVAVLALTTEVIICEDTE